MKLRSVMPTGGPDDEDDNNERESDLSTKEAWLRAQNCSPGDELIVNGEIGLEIVAVNRNGSRIECVGKIQSGNEPWRVLRLDLAHYSAITISTPEKSHQIPVDDISPAGETILSAATADELLPGDVTGEESVDSYIDQRDPGTDFSTEVSVVGECPCGGDIGRLDWKVVCNSCGRWVRVEVWDEWTAANSDGSQDNPPTDSETGEEGSGNQSLGDYM